MLQAKVIHNHVSRVLVALGSNMSSESVAPQGMLDLAIKALETLAADIPVVSPLYRTPAFPAGSGPDYVNAAISFATRMRATEIMDNLHGIEATLGRERHARWGPRVIDLDLIAYDDQIAPNTDGLRKWMELPLEEQKVQTPDQMILPHPRMHERAFVLVPLNDIAPGWVHPVTGLSVSEMLAALDPGAVAEIRRL